MYGKKVKFRFLFLVLIFLTVTLSVFLILQSLKDNVVYFQSPSEIKLLVELDKDKIRVGGMVKKKSVSVNSEEINFIITDFKNEINVRYSGAVPILFEEGINLKAISEGLGHTSLKTTEGYINTMIDKERPKIDKALNFDDDDDSEQ